MTVLETSKVTEEITPRPVVGRLNRPAALVITAVVCLLFFSLTNPTALPGVALIVGFVALGVLINAILRLLLVLSGLRGRLSRRYRRIILVGGTALPVMLLVLQSIGQLTVRDILTLCVLFLTGLFYIGRVAGSRQ